MDGTPPASESASLVDRLADVAAAFSWASAVQAALWLLAGSLAGLVVGRLATRAMARHGNTGLAELVGRGTRWLLLGLGLAMALEQLGFDLGVLLGAAGVASIALGFAAQTSVSNLISGAFLLGERAVQVGDVVTVGTTTGEVLSVDLLSVKLRTFDNRLVRVPNESLIKSEVTNLSAFPIRRIEVVLTIPPDADLDAVIALLHARAEARTDVLVEPAPQAYLGPFGPDGLDLKFVCWARREGFILTQTGFYREVRQALLDSGYRFAAPRRRVSADPAGPPLVAPPDAPPT